MCELDGSLIGSNWPARAHVALAAHSCEHVCCVTETVVHVHRIGSSDTNASGAECGKAPFAQFLDVRELNASKHHSVAAPCSLSGRPW